MALIGRFFGGNAYDSNGSKRSFPNDFPGMPTAPEANFTASSVCGLGDGVAVQGEPIRLDVDILGTILWIPRVTKRP